MKKITKWTPEEDEILKKFWKTNEPYSVAQILLPGRTEAAIRNHAHGIGCVHRKPGPKPEIERNLKRHLKNDGPLSTFELGNMMLCDRRQVDTYIRRLRAKKRVYVAGYIETRGGKLSRRWALGNQPDMPYPTKKERVGVPVAIVANSLAEKKAFHIDELTAALFGKAA